MSENETENNDLDLIEKNYNVFLKICTNLGDRSQIFENFVENYSDRLAVCPLTTNSEFGWCYPGGLVEYSLSVFRNCKNLVKLHPVLNVDSNSLKIVSLFHAFGLIGSDDMDLFEPSEKYFAERGKLYQINKNISFMTTPHRTLFLLQNYGIKLSEEEWVAILLSNGENSNDSGRYMLKEPILSTLLNNSILLTRSINRNSKEQ
jgi:hypothetical protein